MLLLLNTSACTISTVFFCQFSSACLLLVLHFFKFTLVILCSGNQYLIFCCWCQHGAPKPILASCLWQFEVNMGLQSQSCSLLVTIWQQYGVPKLIFVPCLWQPEFNMVLQSQSLSPASHSLKSIWGCKASLLPRLWESEVNMGLQSQPLFPVYESLIPSCHLYYLLYHPGFSDQYIRHKKLNRENENLVKPSKKSDLEGAEKMY